jgi:hypothetical protein
VFISLLAYFSKIRFRIFSSSLELTGETRLIICIIICTPCSKWKFKSGGILLKNETTIYRQKMVKGKGI